MLVISTHLHFYYNIDLLEEDVKLYHFVLVVLQQTGKGGRDGVSQTSEEVEKKGKIVSKEMSTTGVYLDILTSGGNSLL